MPKYRVLIAHDLSQYANVIVEAPDEDAAQVLVADLFIHRPDFTSADEQAHADLVNSLHWDSGDEATHERVIDAEPVDDEEEVDLDLPASAYTAPKEP